MGFIKFSRNLFGGGKRKATTSQSSGSQNVEPNVSVQNQQQNICQQECAPSQSSTSRDTAPVAARTSRDVQHTAALPVHRAPSGSASLLVNAAGARDHHQQAQPQHVTQQHNVVNRTEEYDEIPFDIPMASEAADDFDAMDIPMDVAPVSVPRQDAMQAPPPHLTARPEQIQQPPQAPRQALAPIAAAPAPAQEAFKPPKPAMKAQTFSYGGNHSAVPGQQQKVDQHPQHIRRMQSMPAPKLPSQEIQSTVVCALGEIDALSPMVAEVRRKIAERVCNGDIFSSRRNESWPNILTPYKAGNQTSSSSAAESSAAKTTPRQPQLSSVPAVKPSSFTTASQPAPPKAVPKATWQQQQPIQSKSTFPSAKPVSAANKTAAFKIPDLQVF
jgi:hypothetical protein